MDVKDQNRKAEHSAFKIVALRGFWKIDILEKIHKKLKIRYLEIKLFIQKGSAKIKPRHFGCSGSLQKDRNGHKQKAKEFQYELVRQNFKQYRN